jgi:hypothetical protein
MNEFLREFAVHAKRMLRNISHVIEQYAGVSEVETNHFADAFSSIEKICTLIDEHSMRLFPKEKKFLPSLTSVSGGGGGGGGGGFAQQQQLSEASADVSDRAGEDAAWFFNTLTLAVIVAANATQLAGIVCALMIDEFVSNRSVWFDNPNQRPQKLLIQHYDGT